jgi:hypothetical protein
MMRNQHKDLSSVEIRGLMLDVLSYEGEDLEPDGNHFKRYGYQGTQSDLYRQLELLAIKNGLIPSSIHVSRAAWGGMGYMLHAGCTTNFSNIEIKNIYEQFHLLLNHGIIAPGAIGNYGPNLPSFHVTDYGLKCLKEKEILPYDVDDFLRKIKGIPNITEWVEFYIEEALKCFNANCMEAAVIMLGLSSERIIQEQLDALKDFLSRNYSAEYAQMMGKLPKAIMASDKYALYKEFFDLIKNKVTEQDFKNVKLSMDRIATQVYANFTRITRNSLAHPSETKMERFEVLMIFISFIKYCETQYSFISYYLTH